MKKAELLPKFRYTLLFEDGHYGKHDESDSIYFLSIYLIDYHLNVISCQG